MATSFLQLYIPSQNPRLLLRPVYSGKVSAGQSRFPSAAQDYVMKELDLNERYVTDPPATFMMPVTGDSMIDIGIYPGSMLIVNKAMASKAKSSDIIVAIIEDEFVVKRLYKRGNTIRLLSENKAKAYAAIEFSEWQELEIWGVVQHVINTLP